MEDLIKADCKLFLLETEDVSEYAQTIGLKFEKVIKELNLDDKLDPLMKDVVSLLEQINLMIKEKDDLQNSLKNLESQLEQFKFESKENKLERLRCQKQLEEIEDAYRNEITELLNLILKLKEDNSKLRNLLNKDKVEEDEKQFEQNIDGVENCTQGLLINEKKKIKSLQKELDSKNEIYDKVEKQLEQESRRVETLSKQVQKLKEENLILNQRINLKPNEYDEQSELIEELKNVLSNTIRDHLDEHQQQNDTLSTNNNNYEFNQEYIDKQKNHLKQLQLMQKLIETLSVTVETVNNTTDSSKFDTIKFQQNLNNKLQQLENEQKQQSYRLSSSLINTPIESPKYCSLESNCSGILMNRSPVKKNLLSAEPQPQSKFSLNEIRNIILERNSLQNQIKFLEKQLFSFKKSTIKKDEIKENNFKTENSKLAVEAKEKEHKNENQNKSNSPDDCDPVQGPLPKEPEDHPNFKQKVNNSSFLKFFPLLKINLNK